LKDLGLLSLVAPCFLRVLGGFVGSSSNFLWLKKKNKKKKKKKK
jgi:hypothetical protein